ncbi:MAG TPA: hypothetical protein VJ301_18710 [Propionibacteriaceae bacterium]|nr:hypothetical protein [Propionibacteriaceae bacterium]
MSASRQCRALRLPVAALTLLLLGCSAPAVAPSPVPPATRVTASESSRLSQVRTTVDALVHAARTRDRTGFERLISDRDPAFPNRARLLYDNLSTLPLTRLQMRMEPAEFGLAEARTQLLGSSAWAQRAVVSWRLAGDDADVEHRIWLTFLSDGGQVKLAGTVDEPLNNGGEQKPSWWLGPLTATEHGGATVVVGSGQALDRWSRLAAAALDNVRDDLPDGLQLTWSGRVVLEVPATPRDFESVLGEPAGSYGSIAAVARRMGTADGATRIVVNPRAAQLSSSALQAVLEHEMVHVATRSPDSPAPVWAEEGLAEWVSAQGHADQPSEATGDVLIRVRAHGAPRSFPSDQQFQLGEPNLRLAYAEAWLACRYIADRYSENQLGRFYTELDHGRSVDEASRSALKISEAELITRWRAYLVRLARY